MKELVFVGIDDWDRPVYKDRNEKFWKDLNLGAGKPVLYSVSPNMFNGEPCNPIKKEYEIINKHKENPFKFQYMMLSRLQMDCDYYLGHGNRHKGNLYYGNVAEHIEEMKLLWKDFPEGLKPEWLTWEQILDYELKMMEGVK